MEDKNKIEIINQVTDMSENFISLFGESQNFRMVRSKGLSFGVEDADKHYDPIVGAIFKYMDLKKNFSSNYVRNFIDDLSSDILKKGIENVKKDPLIVDIFDDNFCEITIYLPLSGIEMINKEKLGIGNIIIRRMTDEIVNEISENLEILTRENPYIKDKEKHIKMIRSHLSSFKDKICAEYKMFGERDIVFDTAKKECEKSLDLLRFASIFLYHRDHKITITLDKEISRGYQDIISLNSNYRGFRFNKEFIGPMFNFKISDDSIKKMNELGIFKVSKILEKPERELTDFEKTLLLGMHWIANFQSQKGLENQYLNLAVALEIFLTPESGEQIRIYIAEAVSIILGKSIDEKKYLKEQIKFLYNKRNDIVHGRSDKIPKEEEIVNLRNILINLMLWMIKNSHKFENKKELLELIDTQKLACNLVI